MNKCLVTKLSGSSSNTTLLRIGEMRIKFDKVSEPTLGSQGFGLIASKPVTLQIIGDGYFTDDSFSENKGNTLILNPTDNHFVISGNTSEVAILDKYSLTNVRLDFTGLAISAFYGTNKHISIDDLKYSTGLAYVYLRNAKVTGNIDSLKNLTQIYYLDLGASQVTGDISNLKDLTKITYLNFADTKVTGNIDSLKNLTQLTSLSFNNTKVTGDISNLKDLTKVKNLYFTKCVLTGDLATMPAGCKYITSDRNSVFTWSTRPSSSNIVGMSGSFKVINLDKMLQDLAQCKVDFIESDSVGYKTIVVRGTRTSASDDAVQALQSKGYTVTIVPE